MEETDDFLYKLHSELHQIRNTNSLKGLIWRCRKVKGQHEIYRLVVSARYVLDVIDMLRETTLIQKNKCRVVLNPSFSGNVIDVIFPS